MKIKTVRLFLALSTAAGITGCASGPFSSSLGHSPTSDFHYVQEGNDHTTRVYTSPSTATATNDLGMPAPD